MIEPIEAYVVLLAGAVVLILVAAAMPDVGALLLGCVAMLAVAMWLDWRNG